MNQVVDAHLDTATMLQLLAGAVDAAVFAELRRCGLGGLTHAHGYVVQRLIAAPSTASEMATVLGITQQAVAKRVAEMVRLGVVEMIDDEADRRRRPVKLTDRGWEAVHAARRARAAVSRRIHEAIGADADAWERGLRMAIDGVELADRVATRSVQPSGPA